MLTLNRSRHMESHNFFMCSRCLTAFTTKEQKTLHDKMRACVKVCSNRACKRHTMNFEVSTTVCKCLLSSDDLWAATFRQAFPLVPLPIPWSTKVQSWLIDPADSDLQQDCREQDGAQWHQRLQPGLAPDNIPQQDVLNSHAMGDPLDGSGTSDRSVPQFQSDETADSTLTGFQNAISQESGSLQSNSAVVYPTTDFEGHSAQPVSQADIQLLRTQLAILEERVERPRRSEQDKSAMLRLMWNRLVEIGDQSVQEGGVLRQVATHLTPDLITDNTARNDLVQPTQAMDMRSAMDWDAAGLGPQHLPAAGNEKQRAVSGAADSAYYSGMHMR